jgi:hypothetical protein
VRKRGSRNLKSEFVICQWNETTRDSGSVETFWCYLHQFVRHVQYRGFGMSYAHSDRTIASKHPRRALKIFCHPDSPPEIPPEVPVRPIPPLPVPRPAEPSPQPPRPPEPLPPNAPEPVQPPDPKGIGLRIRCMHTSVFRIGARRRRIKFNSANSVYSSRPRTSAGGLVASTAVKASTIL